MIKAWWTKKTIKIDVQLEKTLGEYETRRLDDWQIKVWAEQEVERLVKYQLSQIIHFEMDKELVKRLATELLSNYDFKSAVQSVMNERVQEYLRKT